LPIAVVAILVGVASQHYMSRQIMLRRLGRNGVLVAALILSAVGVGAIGYHVFDGLSWLDAALNAAMILTGMGPVNPLVSPAAKIFAIVYSLFSGVFFLTMVAVLLAPAVQHFLHRFHLELNERESQRARAPKARDNSDDAAPVVDH
jgi:hypothetical protein